MVGAHLFKIPRKFYAEPPIGQRKLVQAFDPIGGGPRRRAVKGASVAVRVPPGDKLECNLPNSEYVRGCKYLVRLLKLFSGDVN